MSSTANTNLSGTKLIAIVGVTSFLAALGGAFVALSLDNPDVVVTERVVEVAPTEPIAAPAPEDLEALRLAYVDATGQDTPSTLSLMEEIGALVCHDGESADQILSGGLGPDIAMDLPQLEAFVEEVNSVCP